MEYRLLGPLEVLADGEPLDLGAYKQRALLSLLLIHANEVVSTDRIIDEIWGESAGRDKNSALWVVVSRLRSVLEPGREKRSDGTVLLSRAPGYVLVVDPDDIDAVRFERLATEGRALLDADPAAASLVLSESLAIWRGHALEEFAYEAFAEAEVARLEELRLGAVEDRIDADLRAGRARELIGELEGLVRQHPLRQRLTGHLMLALHLAGRQSDALRAFGSLRSHLAEEMGLDPAPELSRLEERIVLDDPELRQRGAARSLTGGTEPGLAVRGYELRDKIGEGAIGRVYRAFQPAVGREVAIKVIRPELANDPAFIRRFEADAQLIASVEHPQIVPIFDYWREPDAAYLVSRRFEHGSLRDKIDGGPMAAEVAMKIVTQIAAALAAAHRQGVVHGDLKPSNVLIDREDTAFVADFGMSRSVGKLADSDQFVAPEQAASGEPSQAADIYSLGAIAAYLLRLTDQSDSVADILSRATAAEPADRFPDVESFIDALTSALVSEPSAVVATPLTNPYRGLRAFDERHAGSFFGRERLIERLLARIDGTGPQGRFVALVGPSGSGKSSVIRAGVVPALRAGGARGSDKWFITTMIPGRHPFEALEDALRAIAVNPPANLLEQLTTKGITETVDGLIPDPSSQVVIVIDQLEELFSLASQHDTDAFMTMLAEAAGDRHSRVKIIATLRADFYDHPLRHNGLGELVRLGTEVLTPMNAAELAQAIAAPAEQLGVTFETGLVALITSDMAGQPSALPLLQYALTELFDERSGSTITNEAYRKLGGVSGALARRADAAFDGLAANERSRARELFLRLVTLNEGGVNTRRRALLSELTDAARGDIAPILDAFGRHRLLTFDRDPVTRGPTVEIAHEALLTEWGRLVSWIDDARADLQAERRLAAAAADWAANDRDQGYLLSGARLSRYDGWLDEAPLSLTSDERAYLKASEESAESELWTERQRVKRLRRLVIGVGAGLVLALVAGGIAFQQRQRANDQAALAEQQAEQAELATLISRSAAVTADDPELAVLLALEAHERAPGDDTRRAVLSALSSASTANRVLSRQPLDGDGDCWNGSNSFYTDTAPGLVDGGPVQLLVIDGEAVTRDVVSGEQSNHGPVPFPCALGGRNGGFGAVGAPGGSIWIGPDLVPLDVAGFVMAATRTRVLVAANAADQTAVRLYDMEGALVGEPVRAAFASAWAVSAEGSLFAVSAGLTQGRSIDGTLSVIAAETGQSIAEIPGPFASALAFDPFGDRLIAARADGSVVTLDPRTGDVLSVVATDESFGYIAVGARSDGALIVVSRSKIAVLDPQAGPIGSPFPIQDIREAFVRPDGLVVTIGNDGRADVYDIDASAIVDRSYDVFPRGWIAIDDGRAAVLDESGGEAKIEVLDLSTGERIVPELLMPDGSMFPALAAYSTSDGVMAVSFDHVLARWQGDTLVEVLDMGSDPEVWNDSWYPGGRLYGDHFAVLGVRPDNSLEASLIRLHGPSGAEVMFTVATELRLGTTNSEGMAHPSATGGLFLIDTTGELTEYGPDGTIVREIETGAETPVAITLDPSGTKVAVSSLVGRVAIVDLATGDVEQLPGNYVASSLGFNSDGSMLGISVWGGEVRLYSVGSGEVPTLIVKGDGTFGAEPGWFDAESGSLWLPASGRILEISLDPARWVDKACEIVSRDLTQEEWERLVPGDEPLRAVCD